MDNREIKSIPLESIILNLIIAKVVRFANAIQQVSTQLRHLANVLCDNVGEIGQFITRHDIVHFTVQ